MTEVRSDCGVSRKISLCAAKMTPLSIVDGKAYSDLRNAWIVPFI